MAVRQRDLPQEWEVRPAPAKGGGKWRKKRRTSQQGGALGEGGEGTSAQARRIAPEGPIFFKKIWEEIDCQNDLYAFVSSLLF